MNNNDIANQRTFIKTRSFQGNVQFH